MRDGNCRHPSGTKVFLIAAYTRAGVRPLESGCLGMQAKADGKLHLRLNTGTSPVEDKYINQGQRSTSKFINYLSQNKNINTDNIYFLYQKNRWALKG